VAGAHEWVERLAEATGWREPPSPCDWAVTEAAFGTPFPGDYKEMCDRFGPGDFCVHVLARPDWGPQPYITALGGDGPQALLDWKDAYTGNLELLAPYRSYADSGTNGLICWGLSDWGRYFWLADAAQAPESWPVLAKWGSRPGSDEPWHRFDMGVPELVYRILTGDPAAEPFEVPATKTRPAFAR
jgi:hypothetical protein